MNRDKLIEKAHKWIVAHDYDPDLLDIASEIDSTLSWSENVILLKSVYKISELQTSLALTPSECDLAIGNYHAGYKDCVWDAAAAGDPDAIEEIREAALIKIQDKKAKKILQTANRPSIAIIHKHKPIAGSSLPTHYGVFDCETEGLFGLAKLICVRLNNGTEMVFEGSRCAHQFVKEITRPKYKGYKLYAHNLEFDLEKIFGEVFGNTMDSKKFTIIKSGSRLIFARFRFNDTNSIELRDSYNLIPQKLSSIGEELGFPKLDTPDKWLTGEPVDTITDDDIKYCKRDCDIVFKILGLYKEMLDPHNIKIKLTIASNAKAIWKAIHLKDKGMFVHTKKDEAFRDSYYGGRVEVFKSRIETKDIYYYDVNSLYPSVMLDNKYPDPDNLKYGDDLMEVLYKNEGCARITVDAPDMKYPVLPYRYGKLIFGTGTFTSVYNFPEIRLALKHGYRITNVEWVLSSKPIDSPFHDYVEYFMQRKIDHKSNDQDALALLDKLMLNSLYGKFGQRVDVEERYVKEEPLKIGYQQVGENTYKLNYVERIRAEETVVCWASYTSSYSRCDLYEYFPEDGLYYCDTDSVFRDTPLPDNLIDPYKFGFMSLEAEPIKHVFVAPKRYAFETADGRVVKKIKGVNKKIVASIPLESFNADIGIFYTKPVKQITGLINGIKPFSEEIVRKNLSNKNRKRQFDVSGESIPLKLTGA